MAVAHDLECRICRRLSSLHRCQPLDKQLQRLRRGNTHDTRLSIDVSIGFVFNDFKNDANPGVRASEFDGMIRVGSRY